MKVIRCVLLSDAESECVAATGDINLTEEGSEDESAARVNLALALVQYYLSLNYFETEEFSQVKIFNCFFFISDHMSNFDH